MDGPQVLDSSRFSGISFQSMSVEKIDAEHWIVRGNLTLHGQTRPLIVTAIQKDGHYRGSANLKQRDLGITQGSIAGGNKKAKDDVTVEVDIELAEGFGE